MRSTNEGSDSGVPSGFPIKDNYDDSLETEISRTIRSIELQRQGLSQEDAAQCIELERLERKGTIDDDGKQKLARFSQKIELIKGMPRNSPPIRWDQR